MAELGLAIAGVAATGAALSKALFGIYHSVRGASRDVREIATQLEVLKSVLRELKRALRKNNDRCSANAARLIRDLLTQCSQIFDGIEDLTAPLRSADGDPLLHPKMGDRLKFHFRKDELRLLKAQLESIKGTMGLLISIIQLNRELPGQIDTDSDEMTSVRLRTALSVATELVNGERTCLADLTIIEEDVYANTTYQLKFARISTWLSGIVGLSEGGSAPSVSQSTVSQRSNRTLSAAHRSITGAATTDVEMLLEKWTTTTVPKLSNSARDAQSERAPRSSSAASDRSLKVDEESDEAAVVPNSPKKAELANKQEDGTPEAHQKRNGEQETESDTGIETESETESESTIENSPYHATARTTSSGSSSSSSASGPATPTTPLVIDVTQENVIPKIPPTSILMNRGDNDDNDTVRDLRRASLNNRRVRIRPRSPSGSHNSNSRVEDWVASDAVYDDARSEVSNTPSPIKNILYQHYTPFSQISILSSQPPSVVSSISTMSCYSRPKKIKNLVKAGKNLVQLERYAEAASLFREAYSIKKAQNELDDEEMLEIMFKIGIVLGELGKSAGAERILSRLLAKQRQLLGEEAKPTQLTRHYLGRIYSRQEVWEKASSMYEALWDFRNQILLDADPTGPNADLALRTGQEYGYVMIGLESFDKAAELLTFVHSTSRKLRGEDDMKITVDAGINLGRALRGLGRATEACEVLTPIHGLCTMNLKTEDLVFVRCTYELAASYLDGKMFNECEALARPVWDAIKSSINAQDLDGAVLDLGECLAKALRGLEKNNEARDVYKVVHQAFAKKFGQNHPRAIKATLELSEILLEQEQEYEAQKRLNTTLVACRPITTETITEDITQVAEKLGPLLLKEDAKKSQAADVYGSIFLGEKKFLGVDSTVTLHNGHQYGSLCFELDRLPVAEMVLAEVWDHRKQVLGIKDLETIASGFQLGQVYFMENKYDAAIETHRSILDTRKDIFGQASAEVIESSEVLGTVLLSHQQGLDSGFLLLREALGSKIELYGGESTTLSSAVRLASLSAGHGRFPDAVELFTWVFEVSRTQDSSKMMAMSSTTGLAAAGFQYIQQNHHQGNELVHRVVGHITQHVGEHSATAQSLAYGQAMLMFLQREGRQFRHIIRQQFNIQKRVHGTSSRKTVRAGEIVAIGTLVDCLLKRSRIDDELDKVNDWLFARKGGWTLAMRFAIAAAVICQQLKFSELAQALLKWLYRTQKRLLGRFEQDTLVTLAIHHAYHLRNLYKKAKKIPTKDHSAMDPRVLLPRIWPALTRSIGKVLTNMTAGDQRSKFFTTWLPKMMTEWTLYQGYRRERMGRFAKIFMPQMEQFVNSPAFAEHVRQTSKAMSPGTGVDDDVASRIWTVASEELEGDIGADGADWDARADDVDSLDFSDILDERATERLRSLGDSLIDLTLAEDGDLDDEVLRSEERAEDKLRDLQRELVSEVVDEERIHAAKDNYEAFEKETDEE